jgi:hypothetical protein
MDFMYTGASGHDLPRASIDIQAQMSAFFCAPEPRRPQTGAGLVFKLAMRRLAGENMISA